MGPDGVLPPEGSDTAKNALGNVQNAGKVLGASSPSGDVGPKSQVTHLYLSRMGIISVTGMRIRSFRKYLGFNVF